MDVNKLAIEFVRDVAGGKWPTDKDLFHAAFQIVEQMCNHQKVKPEQYCHLCGWHNVPQKCSHNDPTRWAINKRGKWVCGQCGEVNP